MGNFKAGNAEWEVRAGACHTQRLARLLTLVGHGEPWTVTKQRGRGLDLEKLQVGRAVKGPER